MKIDAVFTGTLKDAPQAALLAESQHFSGFWVTETSHDPFFPLLRAAEATEKIQIGTAIAVGLARSPMTLAQTAWDLAEFSKGRFMLGLGSQIKPHIIRRFSMPWGKPVQQMRELILSLRAIWDAFQNGSKLNFEGEYYRLNLLTPFFTPAPMDYWQIPVGLAAVGPRMTALAAEVADLVLLHPFTNVAFLKETTMPAINDGLETAGRSRKDFTVVGSLFAITGDDKTQVKLEQLVRQQIGFYGSTPAYRGVLEALGQGELGEELHRLSKKGEWKTMAGLITDDLLNAFAVRGPVEQLPALVQERLGEYYDRVMLTVPLFDRIPAGKT